MTESYSRCRQNIRPHKAFKESELETIFRVAEEHSSQMNALVRLLYDGALRLQDAVGLTFGDITQLQPDVHGERHITLAAKKTTSRRVSIEKQVYDAVKRYQ